MTIIKFNPRKEDNLTEYTKPHLEVIKREDLKNTLNIIEKSIGPEKKKN